MAGVTSGGGVASGSTQGVRPGSGTRRQDGKRAGDRAREPRDRRRRRCHAGPDRRDGRDQHRSQNSLRQHDDGFRRGQRRQSRPGQRRQARRGQVRQVTRGQRRQVTRGAAWDGRSQQAGRGPGHLRQGRQRRAHLRHRSRSPTIGTVDRLGGVTGVRPTGPHGHPVCDWSGTGQPVNGCPVTGRRTDRRASAHSRFARSLVASPGGRCAPWLSRPGCRHPADRPPGNRASNCGPRRDAGRPGVRRDR